LDGSGVVFEVEGEDMDVSRERRASAAERNRSKADSGKVGETGGEIMTAGVGQLVERIGLLERENAPLKKELEFFRRTPTLAQGLKGETLIANLTDGVRTGYKDPYDITVKSGDRLEVKFSHVNVPNNSQTRRWNWHSVLGSAQNKKYDYLVLVGEKDPRYEDQYPANLAFVFFLIPRSDVDNIKTGDDIAINTNLNGVRAPKSLALKRHLVMAEDTFTKILSTADAKTASQKRNG
jgi:hypothetical protein